MAVSSFPKIADHSPEAPHRLSRMRAEAVNFYYGETQALSEVSLEIPDRHVLALIGPSGCGKSTFLRTLNRMNDLVPGARLEGKVLLDDKDIYERSVDVVDLRRRVGMVFQRSNPFPKSIYENVAYGPRIHGVPAAPNSMASWRIRSGGPLFGTKSKHGFILRRSLSPVDSNSDSVSPEPWPCSQMCC